MPMAGSGYAYLAVINVGSALKNDLNYYLQVFLKECRYIEKEEIRYIIRDIVISSSDSDEEKFFV